MAPSRPESFRTSYARTYRPRKTPLQAAGFYNLGSEDGTGQGRAQLIDRNWVVITQSVPAGRTRGPSTRIVLTAVKYGEPTGSSGCPS